MKLWNFWVGRAFRNAVESNNSNFCVSLRQLLRPRSIRLEQSGLKMDTESWNVAEERRVRKLQQIRQLLSIALGPGQEPHCAMERNRGNGNLAA